MRLSCRGGVEKKTDPVSETKRDKTYNGSPWEQPYLGIAHLNSALRLSGPKMIGKKRPLFEKRWKKTYNRSFWEQS